MTISSNAAIPPPTNRPASTAGRAMPPGSSTPRTRTMRATPRTIIWRRGCAPRRRSSSASAVRSPPRRGASPEPDSLRRDEAAALLYVGAMLTPVAVDQDESARLQDMFEQAPGFMALLEGADHRFTVANRAFHDLVGDRDLVGR